jgi:hypothetical protein
MARIERAFFMAPFHLMFKEKAVRMLLLNAGLLLMAVRRCAQVGGKAWLGAVLVGHAAQAGSGFCRALRTGAHPGCKRGNCAGDAAANGLRKAGSDGAKGELKSDGIAHDRFLELRENPMSAV